MPGITLSELNLLSVTIDTIAMMPYRHEKVFAYLRSVYHEGTEEFWNIVGRLEENIVKMDDKRLEELKVIVHEARDEKERQERCKQR